MLAQMKSSREQLATYKKRQEDLLEQTQDPDRRKWMNANRVPNQLKDGNVEAECANQLTMPGHSVSCRSAGQA
jgi:hypothetical protein